MTSEKLKQSLQLGMHHQLLQLVGKWEGTTKTWFEPGDPSDVSPMSGTIRPLMDGRFILHEYKGQMQGKPFEGLTITGYNMQTNNFQTAWIDSFHMGTAIMLLQGKADGAFCNVLGSYPAGEEEWGWRTDIKIVSPDNIILTAYNITPAGEEHIATETNYHRVP